MNFGYSPFAFFHVTTLIFLITILVESSLDGNDKVQARPQENVRHKRGGEDNSNEKTIETLLVLDQKMTQYYGLDASKQYGLTLANIAHDLLRDPSIGPNAIRLVIVKILLLVTTQDNLIINHHGRNTLRSFGQWAALQATKYEANGEKFDYAILLTRYNICKDQEQPCDNSGLSHIGGMCGFPSSVSVIKDQGLSTGFSIAHHIGHSLGMEHDGNGNSCDGRNRIMNPKSGYGEGAFLWSTCSANYLQIFLRTARSKCLNDVPSKEKRQRVSLYANPGSIFDVTSQCELFAGDGAEGCYFGDPVEICIELQCSMPNQSSCLRTGKPPAEGTACGETKWCKHGRCVEKHVSDPSYVNGGWSSWGELKPCTRSCGGGVTYRERSCINPKPIHGGKYCEGDSREYQICNKKPCPEFSVSFKTVQCNRKSGSYYGDVKYDWTYVTSRIYPLQASCNLKCIAKNDAEIAEDFGPALDGTECFMFNLNLPGRCVAGKCISVGCDLHLESRERVDRCGVCKGDGSSCRKAHPSVVKAPAVFVNVSDRPELTAKKIAVSKNSTISSEPDLKLKLVNKTRVQTEVNKNATANITLNTTRGSQNQSLQHNKTVHDTGIDHLFSALKKLKALRALMKAVLNKKCKSDSKCLQKYNYFDLKHKKSEITRPGTFEWVMVSSGCSVNCGIGTEYLYPECHRVDDGSAVGRKFCSMQPEPPERSKACRLQSCVARWTESNWEPCSKSCGGGLQSRNVFCIKTINEDFVVPDVLCNAAEKPSVKQICNKKACPAMWVTEPFGKCSTTCGKGIQIREVYCKVNKLNRGLIIVDDNLCNALERPERELICNVHNPCPGQGNCGGNFTNSSGIITSPHFPDAYPVNKECISEISVAAGMVILLKFTELKINGSKESKSSCQGDFLRIIFGGCQESSGKPYSLYCGNEVPRDAITSTSNKLCLKFFSDDSGTDKGFSLKYTAMKMQGESSKVLDVCDIPTKIVNSSFGALMSPNYPDSYPMNEYCKVTVSSMDKSGFIISFKDFSVGTSGPSKVCDNDYLEIHHNGLVEKVCGHQKAKKAAINGDSFTVIFQSGNMKLGGAGFIMTYISKNVMREQLDKINLKKQELAKLALQRTIALPQYKEQNAARLRPVQNHVQNQQYQLVEALTSLKKTGISHPLNATNGRIAAKKNSTRPSLKSVLDMLAGGQKQNTIDSFHLNGVGPPVYEDYTKAGVYKKAAIGSANQPATELMLRKEPTNARRTQSIQQNVVPAGNIYRQSAASFVRSNVNNQVQRAIENKALWEEYWKRYSQYYINKRGNIARPFTGSVFNPQTSGYWQQSSVVPRNYVGNGLNAVPSGIALNTCPVAAALQCPVTASLSKCQADIQCGYGSSMRCCQTACPYAPFVCMWTRTTK